MQNDSNEYLHFDRPSDSEPVRPELGEQERKTENAQWFWDNLGEELRRILIRKAASRTGIRFDDTVDYALLSWNDFPETGDTVGLKDQLVVLIDEFTP
ncbi:MAG: hypothetical protein HYY51_00370 [Candidatus Magasanikbacteria bacterium]|nr:hypothetical protein [Candidatus Magasanikbacteria bacterium]